MYNGLQGGNTTNFLQPAATAAHVSGNPTWSGQLVQPASPQSTMLLQPTAPYTVLPGGGHLYLGPNPEATSTAAPTPPPDNSAQIAAQQGQIFQGLYESQIGNLQNQLGSIGALRDQDVSGVNNVYGAQGNILQGQHATGMANIDLGQRQLDLNRSNSLRDLGNNLRSMYNSYSNQLGVGGGGFSSAAPMIAYGLQQQANTGKGDIENQYGNQQSGLNLQRSGLNNEFTNQLASLEAQKQQALSGIASNYAQKQQALQQAIASAKGDEARYLAIYGQGALAQDALNQMRSLQAQYADQIGQVHAQAQAVRAPNIDISQFTGVPNVQPISTDALTGLGLPANQASFNDQPLTGLSLTKKPSDQAA